MKKLLPFILILAFALIAVSCGNNKDTVSQGTSSVAASSAVQSENDGGSSVQNGAEINADDFDNPTSSDGNGTSSTFSITVGPGEDEEGWGEIF